jgi:uncharacterized protein (TIGR03067 family)
MRWLLAILGALMSLGLAPSPFPHPIRGDLKRLQGTWVMVAAQNDPGKVAAEVFNEPIPGLTWTIAGDSLLASTDPGIKFRISLDVQATPKRLVATPPHPIFGVDRVQWIYRLQGDVLTVCFDPGGRSPPSAFPGPDDQRLVLFVFKPKQH